MFTSGILLLVAAWHFGGRFYSWWVNPWQTYSAERFEHARSRGRIVVVYLGADWDAACQQFVRVFRSAETGGYLRWERVEAFEADLTGPNEDAYALLSDAGGHALPAVLIFGRDGKVAVHDGDAIDADVILGDIKRIVGDE